ncbi:leucine-rich repeat domain-containing protein [Polaribacter sp. Z022]|uniref:leucine-rich repeat domain-containing protein n=1 Tax=Polaribacter sp. Z022 TaxID=2927125 RepID=UPI0020225DC6|nr:leucine-rich repeat domain-containing protein [Polaribacter sp. Z022]MCL7752443.1 T9SS type A sorting domain-containing protein [Polaribacter sp. Z022]
MIKNFKTYIIIIIGFLPYLTFSQQLKYQSHTMEYDDINRLTKVFFSNGIVHEYVYDNLGNRLERKVYEAPKTYVPDDAFEQKLIDLGYDTVMDDYVYNHKIDKVETLYINDLGINDLTGIEGFISLKNLESADNNLSSIDVSLNSNLERLFCARNKLTSIDISKNANLKYLYCHNNQISSINLKENKNLVILFIELNQLNDLDVSNNLLLENLICGNNLLQEINVSKNTNLEFLDCSNLNLTELDISKNLKLDDIRCNNNQIKTLDLSSHNKIEYLRCQSNDLESLNLKNSNNNILEEMNASDNPNLFCIQVADYNNANNGNGVYKDWNIDTHVQYSYNCQSLTYVPDDAFEQRLIDLGYDVVLNDYVVTAEIDDVTFLSASDLGIQDVTGIEDFISIENLSLNTNSIEFIDLSQNTQLKFFKIAKNNLTSIDVTNNPLLESLSVSDNQLTSLDLSNNPELFFLSCNYNQLTDLDISNNKNLGLLNAHYNNISNLDVSQNSNLTYIWITNNPIESLDFSNNPKLDELNARNCEQLSTINVKNGNNNLLTSFQSQNSPKLYCIQVDDENAANNATGVYSNWNTDNQIVFSEDCEALGLNEFGLPPDNYTISTVGLTCINSNDGVIRIEAKKERIYNVNIVNQENNFDSNFQLRQGNNWTLNLDYFDGGEYYIYITLDGVDENLYKKTFILNLDEPEPLEAVSSKSSVDGKYAVTMTKGTAPYTIKVNNEVIKITHESQYSFDVLHGDVVEVSSSKSCEGKFTEIINILDAITLYPSPTDDIVFFAIPISEKLKNLDIQLFDMNGQLVETFNMRVKNSKIELSVKHLSNGVYLAKFPALGDKTFKVVKK